MCATVVTPHLGLLHDTLFDKCLHFGSKFIGRVGKDLTLQTDTIEIMSTLDSTFINGLSRFEFITYGNLASDWRVPLKTATMCLNNYTLHDKSNGIYDIIECNDDSVATEETKTTLIKMKLEQSNLNIVRRCAMISHSIEVHCKIMGRNITGSFTPTPVINDIVFSLHI